MTAAGHARWCGIDRCRDGATRARADGRRADTRAGIGGSASARLGGAPSRCGPRLGPVEARRLPLAKEGEFPKSGHRVGGLASHGHGTPPSPSPGAGVGYTISHLGGGQGSAEKQPERRPRGRDGPRVRSQDPCPPLLPEDQRGPSWPESDKSWGRRGKAPDVELLLSHPLRTRNSQKWRVSSLG